MDYQFCEFTGERVTLDGNSFEGCGFTNCELVYSGGALPRLSNCRLNNSRFTFVGAASNTINLMAAMHKGGFKEIIEETVITICGGTRPRRPQRPARGPINWG